MDNFETYYKHKYWYVSFSLFRQETDTNGFFIIETKGKLGFSINDKIIILNGTTFSSKGRVIEIIPDEERFYDINIFRIEIGEVTEIEEQPTLGDLAYSLPKIYKHFNNPILHFKRNYGKLTVFEYNTIVNNDIFISRTALGVFYDTLPAEHRQSFKNYLNDYKNYLIPRDFDYIKLLEIMLEYVENNIVSHAEFLMKSDLIMKNELNVKDKIGFQDANEDGFSNINLIDNQINVMKSLDINIRQIINEFNNDLSEIAQLEKEKNREFKDECIDVFLN